MSIHDFDLARKAAEKLSPKERAELARLLLLDSPKKKVPRRALKLEDFYGKIAYPEDAREYQERLRAEWDR